MKELMEEYGSAAFFLLWGIPIIAFFQKILTGIVSG